ncbi:hypothetical protein FS749_011941 [Ceratobasidium sp. UAMH 11750]|nr:hypothetical protein FS749_011941 [Ceratobasidium sp. UAMH 11750]
MRRDASSELSEEPEDAKPVIPVLPLRADTVRDEEFGYPDENVFLTVENVTFFVYKSRLLEFRKLKPMLQSHTEIELEGKAIDFRHTFKVLWPKIFYFSSSEFDTPVWMSALRVATNYDHPALRTFAISNLERKELPIMDYVPLAREFDAPHWEDRATNYLVSRDEPITVEEAELLGIESFARVVVRREQRLVTV